MKNLIRIAPLLIVLTLGTIAFPGVQAVEIPKEDIQEPIKKKSNTNFRGLMILPNSAEQLLYSSNVSLSSDAGSGADQLKESEHDQHEKSNSPDQRYSKTNCNKSVCSTSGIQNSKCN